ncbi:hypothetical protein GIW79_06335 [Pseudomonas sp. PA-7-1E]|uniref:SPFH domain-containing protein n=1 Tax=unclassified Pseudomonas TaxID=196821 RepID=UPI001EFF0EA5|nr:MULTISPECIES: SPFH domain-containing protein [unclassified Pseudomonas]MCF5040069.1 hypothetical protein [Pseudomonas sp. PA-7-1E]MCF5131480.1 hypothetical protein [Pseudomonas sp. PA-6-4F]
MKRIAAIAMLCLLAVTAGCSKVPAGYTGVIVNLMGSDKGVAPTEATVGYKWLTPNEELFLFPTFAQNFNLQQVKFQDRDGMTISAPIGITLRAKPGAAPLLFQTYRKSMDEIIQVNVPQVVRNAFNNAGSKVKASEVYGPGKEAFLKAIETQVQQHFDSKGIVVESLYLNGEIVLPPQVVEALNNSITATQKAQQRENELRQTEAEAAKVRAAAQGDKDAAILKAQGEAESLNIRGEALRKNPGVVELNAIEKWDGKLPVYMTSGSATPFIGIGK